MKKFLFALMLICPVFFLTGCIKIEENIVINDDNTANVSSAFLMDARLIEMAGGQNPFEESIEQMRAKAPEAKVENITKDGYTGVEVTNKIKNIEKDDLKPVADEIKILNKDKRVLSVNKGFFVSTYTLNVDYDMTNMGKGQSASMDKKQAESFMKADLNIQIPRKAKENNASSVNEEKHLYTWNLKLFEHNKIKLVFEKYNYFNMIAAGLGLLLVFFFLFLFKEKKEEPDEIIEENTGL